MAPLVFKDQLVDKVSVEIREKKGHKVQQVMKENWEMKVIMVNLEKKVSKEPKEIKEYLERKETMEKKEIEEKWDHMDPEE